MVRPEIMRDITLTAAIGELLGESKVRELFTEQEAEVIATKFSFLVDDGNEEAYNQALKESARAMFREAVDRLLVAEVSA